MDDQRALWGVALSTVANSTWWPEGTGRHPLHLAKRSAGSFAPQKGTGPGTGRRVPAG